MLSWPAAPRRAGRRRWSAGRPYADADAVSTAPRGARGPHRGRGRGRARPSSPDRGAGRGTARRVVSRSEQSGIDQAGDRPSPRRWRTGNAAYEETFDRVYPDLRRPGVRGRDPVRAAPRGWATTRRAPSAAEIVRAELREIDRLRLHGFWPAPARRPADEHQLSTHVLDTSRGRPGRGHRRSGSRTLDGTATRLRARPTTTAGSRTWSPSASTPGTIAWCSTPAATHASAGSKAFFPR